MTPNTSERTPGPAHWRLVTPRSPGGSAAIGAFHITGDIGHAMSLLDIPEVAVGEVRLRRFADIDRGVVARPARDALLLMPHAGPAVIRRIETWLESRGLARDTTDDPRTLYPEASSLVEARMLHALARAASPLAIDLLLEQPRRWSLADPSMESDPAILARSAILNRLITPPTVVALGPPNIGKSTLLNALAGRSVSIVADEPGTTRDHVGVRLDLAGIVVNYLDTPGINPAGAVDDIQRDAQHLARTAAAAADLVLLFADPTTTFIETDVPSALRLGLRSDLGPTVDATLCISARTGESLDTLVAALRERLVPMSALGDPGPWRFW